MRSGSSRRLLGVPARKPGCRAPLREHARASTPGGRSCFRSSSLRPTFPVNGSNTKKGDQRVGRSLRACPQADNPTAVRGRSTAPNDPLHRHHGKRRGSNDTFKRGICANWHPSNEGFGPRDCGINRRAEPFRRRRSSRRGSRFAPDLARDPTGTNLDQGRGGLGTAQAPRRRPSGPPAMAAARRPSSASRGQRPRAQRRIPVDRRSAACP
jgi:hypothetical protein